MLAWRELISARSLSSKVGLCRVFSHSTRLRSTEEEYATARRWYSKFLDDPLPRIGDVSYARSSGPGGQNVNKVNSKAQLRIPLSQLLPLVPTVLHSGLRTSRYYTASSDSILIQADDSRKQAENKDACYRRLTEMVTEIYRSSVPGETSKEQKERVKELKTQYNETRLRNKKMHSNKKASRAKGFGD